MKSILIVENDVPFSLLLKNWLERNNCIIHNVSTLTDAKKSIIEHTYNLVLSNMRLPDGLGIELIKWINDNHVTIPIIIMANNADIQSAVKSMKLGAADYIQKPFLPEHLLLKLEEAYDKSTSTKKSSTTQSQFIKGSSPSAIKLYEYVNLVAPTNLSVIIKGNSGTGKEHIAQLIHQLSKRNKKAFIAVDCGAISKELAASEFFGHVKGSYTGAFENKTGCLVKANGGTVFMDEIGNLSYDIQKQLLRALEERIVQPLGSNENISVDFRLIVATNENLSLSIKAGKFREDLYNRINEFILQVPSLNERKEDLPEFIEFFLTKSNEELNKNIEGFTNRAKQYILDYHWPGNIRQLKNTIRKATLLAQGSFIDQCDLEIDNIAISSIELYDERREKEKIIRALEQTNNNKTRAAQLLNIDRKTIYNKMKLYNITK